MKKSLVNDLINSLDKTSSTITVPYSFSFKKSEFKTKEPDFYWFDGKIPVYSLSHLLDGSYALVPFSGSYVIIKNNHNLVEFVVGSSKLLRIGNILLTNFYCIPIENADEFLVLMEKYSEELKLRGNY